jgi:hypothetical protein
MYFNGTNFMTILFNAVSGTQVSIADTTNRGTGSWTHYALTYSGTTATLYVNGSSVASNASVTYTGENGTINGGGLCIGDYNGTGVGAVAYFDMIHSYNRAYSSAQVLALYNAEYIGPTVTISSGSITGWTLGPSAITTTSSLGNPAPCISAAGRQYGYYDLATRISGLTTFKSHIFTFDIFCESGSLINLFFGCNSSGAGQMWRLETRDGASSGITNTTSWTFWNYPATGPTLSGSTWYTVVITISSAGVATYTYNGIAGGQSYTIADNGTYIGIQGDGLSGGYVDNILFL